MIKMGRRVLDIWLLTLALVLFSSFCSIMSLAYNIEGGEIALIRPDNDYIDSSYIPPEYLSIEDMFFYTCIQEKDTPVRTSILCLDDTSFEDLETYRWSLDPNKNCYISSYDLGKKECGDLVIESEYVKDDEVVKISQPIKVNRFSSILDVVLGSQYSDGGWRNSTETASGIWALSHYRKIFEDEIVLANRWLKEYRDNEFKCWPNKDCTVLDTAKVLAFLTLAQNNDSLRIMHDGNVFLKKWQNYYKEGDIWNLTIYPFESGDTNCIISFQRNHLNEKDFILNENISADYALNVAPDERLIVICDQNVKANLLTDKGEEVFVYEGDNMSYFLPYQCWPKDSKWGGCDVSATLYALMTDIEDERKDVAIDYLESLRHSTIADEDYLQDEKNITPTAQYLYLLGNQSYSMDNDRIISWLRFRQNNNGSWGNGTFTDRIVPTAFSIMAFLSNDFTRNNEVIEDAEAWINIEELKLSQNKTAEYNGWNSTEFNALALTVLKNNARPLLKVTPKIILVDSNQFEFEIYNPTPFPLDTISYEFSDKLKDILDIPDKEDEILAYSYVKMGIERKKAETGNLYGFLTISNNDNEMIKIPVLVVNYPTISLKQKQDSLSVFGAKSRLDFDVAKTNHNFDCSLIWEDPDITSKTDYKITGSNELSVDISFRTAERMENTYKGEFTCVADSETFELPFSIDVSRYGSFPFSLDTDSILINETGQDSFFSIKNNLDESLDVEVKFQKSDNMFDFSRSSFTIDPNAMANITIFNNAMPDMNITKTNTIEITALSQPKTINFRAFIISDNKETSGSLLMWIIWIAILSLLIGGGVAAYYYKDKVMQLFKKGSNVDKIKIRIKRLEEREKKTAILNMIHIMRMLNKDDKAIKKKLLDESFTDAEIDAAFEAELNDGEEEDNEEAKA